jgi:hypothetical protein
LGDRRQENESADARRGDHRAQHGGNRGPQGMTSDRGLVDGAPVASLGT